MNDQFGPSAAAGALRRLPRVERTEEGRVVAGVCSGIAAALGADPSLVRLVFAILTLADGSGIILYLGTWLYLPSPDAAGPRSSIARIGGLVLFALASLSALHGLGLAESLLAPAALITAGVIVVSRRTGDIGTRRVVVATVLIVAGTIYYANLSGPFGGDRPVRSAAVAIALAAVVTPWLWRLARERDAERLARIRTEERADVAARVHDSVLQTLALIQRHSSDARQVATLARQQERELRGWLYGRAPTDDSTLVAAVERAAAEVEQLHDARIDVVSAGDAPLDERGEALVLAAREAMTNAAKFAGAETISVYVEAGDAGASVFVRDRGSGFDPAAVPPDRHGIRDSIEARIERHGGAATVTSIPGVGTEIELSLPRTEP